MQKLTNEFKIEFTKGDTYALAIKFKNITEDLRLAFFSVKDNPDDAPLIQKSLGAGIDKIDDRDYKNEKTYKFQLQPADTVNLEANVQYLYDIQVTIGNVVKTVLHGVFVLRNTISGTTSVTASNLEIEVDDEVETELLATTPATNGVEYEQDPVACAKIGDLTALATMNKETIVQAVNEVKNGVTNNANDLYKIKNGTLEVPNAKNAKNADGASQAGNVTSAINGQALPLIFESDGTTVKKATNAEMATVANSIGSTVVYEGLANFGVSPSTLNFNLEAGYRYALIIEYPNDIAIYEGIAYKDKENIVGAKFFGVYHNFSCSLEWVCLYTNNDITHCGGFYGFGYDSTEIAKIINVPRKDLNIKIIRLEKVFN